MLNDWLHTVSLQGQCSSFGTPHRDLAAASVQLTTRVPLSNQTMYPSCNVGVPSGLASCWAIDRSRIFGTTYSLQLEMCKACKYLMNSAIICLYYWSPNTGRRTYKSTNVEHPLCSSPTFKLTGSRLDPFFFTCKYLTPHASKCHGRGRDWTF